MKITVVIPVYNMASKIHVSIDSVLAQNYDDLEIIIINDGSTDNITEIVEGYKDQRIKIVNTDNKGPFVARKLGVSLACGDYLLFLDADDWLVSNTITELCAVLQGRNVDFVQFGLSIPGFPDFESRVTPSCSRNINSREDILQHYFDQPLEGTAFNKLYKTETLKKAYSSLPDARLLRGEDWFLFFALLVHSESALFVTKKYYHYDFDDSISNAKYFDAERAKVFLSVHSTITEISDYLRGCASELSDSEVSVVFRLFEATKTKLIMNEIPKVLANVQSVSLPEIVEYIFNNFDLLDILVLTEKLSDATLFRLLENMTGLKSGASQIKNILLLYPNLGIGGLQNVLKRQSEYLLDIGYNVSIAYYQESPIEYQFDSRVNLVFLESSGVPEEEYYTSLINAITNNDIDLLWNHEMYSRSTVVGNLIIAQRLGINSAITLHSFCLRFLFDNNRVFKTLAEALKLYDLTITLDKTSQRFWEAFGAKTFFLPNPVDIDESVEAKELEPTEPIKLLWIGRLDKDTKQILQLPLVSYYLKAMGVSHKLTIVGSPVPGAQYNIHEILQNKIDELDVKDCIVINKPTLDVNSYYLSSDVFLGTSIIEGFPMTLSEAASFALPIIMYDLPYLSLVRALQGVHTVPFGDAEGLALKVRKFAQNKSIYKEQSIAILDSIREYSKNNSQRELLYEMFECLESVKDSVLEVTSVDDSVILYKELVKLQYSQMNRTNQEFEDLKKN